MAGNGPQIDLDLREKDSFVPRTRENGDLATLLEPSLYRGGGSMEDPSARRGSGDEGAKKRIRLPSIEVRFDEDAKIPSEIFQPRSYLGHPGRSRRRKLVLGFRHEEDGAALRCGRVRPGDDLPPQPVSRAKATFVLESLQGRSHRVPSDLEKGGELHFAGEVDTPVAFVDPLPQSGGGFVDQRDTSGEAWHGGIGFERPPGPVIISAARGYAGG